MVSFMPWLFYSLSNKGPLVPAGWEAEWQRSGVESTVTIPTELQWCNVRVVSLGWRAHTASNAE